jgi:hypothetical protein
MSEVGRSIDARKKNAARSHRTGHQSEGRAVKRDLPRSHLHRAAPSLSVPGLPHGGASHTTEGRHAARRCVSGHEAQASEREHPRVSLKGMRVRPLHREATKSRVLESQLFRSAEVGRTHRRPRRPNASHIAQGTRGLARRYGLLAR